MRRSVLLLFFAPFSDTVSMASSTGVECRQKKKKSSSSGRRRGIVFFYPLLDGKKNHR